MDSLKEVLYMKCTYNDDDPCNKCKYNQGYHVECTNCEDSMKYWEAK